MIMFTFFFIRSLLIVVSVSYFLIRGGRSAPDCFVFVWFLSLWRELVALLFSASREEQSRCRDHDSASANGEDRGTDAAGGRQGGELGVRD